MDSLLFMAMAYTSAFFILKLNAGYYFLPSIFIGIVVLFYWISEYLHSKKIYAVLLLSICFYFIFFNYNQALMQYKVHNNERRIFIPALSYMINNYGTNFKMYGKREGNFNDEVFNWHKTVLNVTINYILETENNEYVITSNNVNEPFKEDVIIFSAFSNLTPDENEKLNKELSPYKTKNILNRWGLSFHVKEN